MSRDLNQLVKMARESFETGKSLMDACASAGAGLTKALGHSLKDQYDTEILTYLLYLTQSAGGCNDRRAEFLNRVLNRDFTAGQYNELIRRLDLAGQDFSNLIPVCIKAARKADEANGDTRIEQLLIRVFDRLGETARLYSGENQTMEEMDQRIYILMLTNWVQNQFNQNTLQDLNTRTHLSASGEKSELENTKSPAAEDEKKNEEKEEEKTAEELLEELNSLVGLEGVKKQVTSLINLLKIRKIRRERQIKDIPVSMHLVFTGNPGTGKTTVARLLAKLYKALGALSKGQLVEVDRSDLVGGYVGQTAIKTQEVCDSAHGGVLFIDEAYSLASSSDKSDFGFEAINTLLVEMENHRDDLAVIVAGYPDLMEDFLKSNPGLRSRFNNFIQFDDYDGKELLEIFELQCSRNGYLLTEESRKKAGEIFEQMYENRDESFANGRTVRNFFEKVMVRQANRLASQESLTDEELMTLTVEDLNINEEDQPEKTTENESSLPETGNKDHSADHSEAKVQLPVVPGGEKDHENH